VNHVHLILFNNYLAKPAVLDVLQTAPLLNQSDILWGLTANVILVSLETMGRFVQCVLLASFVQGAVQIQIVAFLAVPPLVLFHSMIVRVMLGFIL